MDINALDKALSKATMTRSANGGSGTAKAPAFPDIIGMMADQDRAPADARRANEGRQDPDTRGSDTRQDANHRQDMIDRSRDATAAERRQDRANEADAADRTHADQAAAVPAVRKGLGTERSTGEVSTGPEAQTANAESPVVPDAAPLPVSLGEARKAAQNAAEAAGSRLVPASGQVPAGAPGMGLSGNGQAAARQDLPGSGANAGQGGQAAQAAQLAQASMTSAQPATPAPATPATAAQMAAAQKAAAQNAADQKPAAPGTTTSTPPSTAASAQAGAAQAGKSGPVPIPAQMKAAADLPPGMKVSIETSANAQANAKPDTGAPSQAGSNQAQASATGPANSAAALNAKAPEPVPAQLPSQAVSQQAAQQAQQALEGAQQRAADTGSPNSPASQNAANQSANAQNAGNQNPGNQNPGNQNPGNQNPGNQNPGAQQQGANAQPTFQFGQASFGGNTPEAAASRAQFQQIMATRTARPAPLGATSTSSNALGAGQSGLTSSPIAAGPGGPQSTFSASLASQVAQATPGRSSATPGTAVDQVAVKLSSSAKDGGGKISIKLNPEELGRVDVKLDIGRDGIVRATVMADRPETLDLLQRDARGLERALQEAGLKTDGQSLNFEGQQQREANERGQSDRPGGSNGNPDDGTADDLADANTTDTESGPSDDGSLNLVA